MGFPVCRVELQQAGRQADRQAVRQEEEEVCPALGTHSSHTAYESALHKERKEKEENKQNKSSLCYFNYVEATESVATLFYSSSAFHMVLYIEKKVHIHVVKGESG